MDPLTRRVAHRFIATVGNTLWPTEKSREDYLKAHPNADPADHTVKKDKEHARKPGEKPEEHRTSPESWSW